MADVSAALDNFIGAYLAEFPDLREIHDPKWRSPCEDGQPFRLHTGLEVIRWQPLKRAYARDFDALERALETDIHPDIKSYFGSYWSGGLEATAPDGHVSLIMIWNIEDADRLVENLIGHAMAKQRAKSPFTVFFACTESDSDLFLAVDNQTGHVVLERPGYKPIREVAESLAEFLGGLTPASPYLHPERAMLAPEG
ncbi:MAG: SecY-interacting protein Syd [Gammaproteobacteria bacterium]|nr:SecY-interacting protein Syd [Gammaproteobacteria bacterium]